MRLPIARLISLLVLIFISSHPSYSNIESSEKITSGNSGFNSQVLPFFQNYCVAWRALCIVVSMCMRIEVETSARNITKHMHQDSLKTFEHQDNLKTNTFQSTHWRQLKDNLKTRASRLHEHECIFYAFVSLVTVRDSSVAHKVTQTQRSVAQGSLCRELREARDGLLQFRGQPFGTNILAATYRCTKYLDTLSLCT